MSLEANYNALLTQFDADLGPYAGRADVDLTVGNRPQLARNHARQLASQMIALAAGTALRPDVSLDTELRAARDALGLWSNSLGLSGSTDELRAALVALRDAALAGAL